MISRFKGTDGRPRLIEALRKQTIVDGDLQIAERLATDGELVYFDAGVEVIAQGASDFCLYMILMGTASIFLNGREYLRRGVGTHIGEMTLIDPRQLRSASVRAHEPMVVLKVEEPVFTDLANSLPKMWRNIAIELGSRLRNRNTLLRARNPRPLVFIGSSSEELAEANALRVGLPGYPTLDVKVWDMGTFRPSRNTLESLATEAANCDFAILVLGSDDIEISRGAKSAVPRDNVIFELGLFMGALGRERTFFVHPKAVRSSLIARIVGCLIGKFIFGGLRFKLPSDLAGITALTYEAGVPVTLGARLEPACKTIADEISRSDVR